MDLFRSKKRDIEQASLEDGPGLKRKHHGLSNSLDNLLDIAKENDECLGTTSDNTASESEDDTDTNKASKKQKAFAKISIKREKKKEKELRKKTEKNMISMDDFLGKQTEFKMWLYEEKCKNAGDISSPKLKVFFKQFVRLWNKKKLAPKYYRCSTLPASPAPLTTRKCNFLTESGNVVPLPTDGESNAFSEVNLPTSPFVTFGKTPPKVFRSKKFQLFGSSKDVALLSVAPLGSPQVVNIKKENSAKSTDQYQVPKIGTTTDKSDEIQEEIPGGAVPYKVSVFPWATNEEDHSSNNDKFEICSTATPPRLQQGTAAADEESWPPPPSEKEIFGGNSLASKKDSPHVPPPPPPRIGSLKKSDPVQRSAKSPKLAANYADPYDTLSDVPSVKRDISSHYQDPVDCVSAESRTIPDNPRLVIQTFSQNDEPDLSLYCKPVSEKRLSKEELEEMYAKPLKRAKKNDIGSIDGMKVKQVAEEETNSDLLNEIMEHINKTKPEVDDKVQLTKQSNPDYATIDECMGEVTEHKTAAEAKCENVNNKKRDIISIGNIPLLQPKVSSPKFASISRSKKIRVMAASTEKIYETYLSHGRKGNPFKGKLDDGQLGKSSFGTFTQSLKLKSKSQPDISFNEGLQAVDIDYGLDKDCDHKMSSPSLSTFKPVENASKFHENLKNNDRAKSYEDDLRCVSEPKTPTIIATPSFDSLCDVTPLSCKYMSSQSLPTKSGSFESLSDHSHLSMSTSSSLSFGPDGKSGSLQSLQSDKSLSPVKEEEETTQNSEKAVKDMTEKCETGNVIIDNGQNMDKEPVKDSDVFSKNSLALTPGKISALKHGIDLSVYLLKPQKDEDRPGGEEAVKTSEVKSSVTDRASAKKPLEFHNPKLFETQSRLVIKDTLSGVRTKLEQGKPQTNKEMGRRHTVQTVQDVNPDDQKKANVPNIGIASKTRKVEIGKSKPVSFEGARGQIVGNKSSEMKKRMLSVDDHYLETDLDSVTSDRPKRQMKKSKSHSGFERDSNTVTTEIW